MFQIGEYVVHGNDGICEVKDITQLELPGGSSKRQYYLLVPQKEKNGRIYSPVESSKVQTRKVITKQEADTLIREIPAIQAAWVENEKLRENVYKEAIKSCDLRELVKIIKNMYLRWSGCSWATLPTGTSRATPSPARARRAASATPPRARASTS